jgi:hypothetical protein
MILSTLRHAVLAGTLTLAMLPVSWANQGTTAASPYSSRDQFKGVLRFLPRGYQHETTSALRNTPPHRATVRLSRGRPMPTRLRYARYGYRLGEHPPYGRLARRYLGYGYPVAVSSYRPYQAYRYFYYYPYPLYYYPYAYGYVGY